MKGAACVASMLLIAFLHSEATNDECKGKTANVFLNSSYLRGGDYFSLPDTYVKMTIGHVTRMSPVIDNKQTAVFKQWFVFKNAQSDILKIEVWDKDGGLNGKDDFMGKCLIQLNKPVSEEKCSFENGEVSLSYTCI